MTDAAIPAAPPPPRAAGAWRRWWFPYPLLIVLGAVAGFVLAIAAVRGGGTGDRIGPWETARDYGTADQGARGRAVTAAHGLLALPASEARYFTARGDDAGRPLDGRCTYRVAGGALPAQWWSLTAYDADGYLLRNDRGIYSVASPALAAGGARWSVAVGPGQRPGAWIPSGGAERIALTLRLYLPADGGTADPERAALPTIVRESCP